MAGLDLYRAKRDFARTREPKGAGREPKGAGRRAKAPATGGAFVIHKHAARRLHYDLRLEHDGVLWSWAVTRGPSLDPAEKRLAVHVEDHPLEYGGFEGTIPKGEYGGGTVAIWDEGRWQPEGDPGAGLAKGHLAFSLEGHKLAGKWHLVRMKGRGGEKRENWLLIKVDDEAARPEGDILEEMPNSVTTGRSIDEIATEAETGEGSRRNGFSRAAKAESAATGPITKPANKTGSAGSAGAGKGGAVPRGDGGRIPDFVEPCLARLATRPPQGGGWVHEVKFDGYRIQARVAGGKVRLLTRTGLDWTDRFGDGIVAALAALPVEAALLDGEIVALAENGISSFGALQAALSDGRPEGLVYFAFDLLFLDGEDLRREPLAARHERLAALMPAVAAEVPVRLSEQFAEEGDVMLAHSCRLGLEGVVSKRADAPYRSGRGRDWVKSKCTLRQEFVIAGYVPSTASRSAVGSLVVGYREGGTLKPAGRVGTGFTRRQAEELRRRLDAIKARTSPYEGEAGRERGIVWVEPELAAEVEFGSWTEAGSIRHAAYRGLRDDKPAEEIVAERPEPAEEAPARAPAKRGRKAPAAKATHGAAEPAAAGRGAGAAGGTAAQPSTAGIRLTHPDKVLWPDCGLTKGGLLDYYAAVWPRIERHVVGRPLSLVRAPDGIDGQRFFQKHASKGMSASIRVDRDPKDGTELLSIADFAGLAALVQLGVLEIHGWGSTVADIERPDLIVFDLDPDEGVGPEALRDGARAVRDGLARMGLTGFLKTSGGKGYHVVAPLAPKAEWPAVKDFCHRFAKVLAEAEPKRYTATLSKKARRGKIFIDYLRNGRGATAIIAFSTRARPGAPIAVPIAWDDLDRVAPNGFTALEDGATVADAWGDWRAAAVPLPGTT